MAQAPRYSQAELAKKLAKQNNQPLRSVSRTSGYSKSTAKSASNSSFWMDEDVTEELTSGSENKAERFVKLAAYQRAISNFVKIVTQRGDIKIAFSSGEDSYTDDKTVIISSALNEKEFDVTVGLALHEASHCALTDFKFLRNAINEYSKYGNDSRNWWANNCYPVMGDNYNVMNEIKYLFNVIEDRRIDKFIYDQAPGYKGYYKAMYDKLFNSKAVDKALENGLLNDAEKWEDYKFHITNFTNPKRNLKVLPGLQDVWDLVDIKNINRFKNSQEVFECAVQAWKIIQSNRLEVIRKRKEEEEKKRQEEEARKAQEQQEKFTNGEVEKDEPEVEQEEDNLGNNPDGVKGDTEEEEDKEMPAMGQSPTGKNQDDLDEELEDENDNLDIPESQNVPVTEQELEDGESTGTGTAEGEETEDEEEGEGKGNGKPSGDDNEYDEEEFDEEEGGAGSEADMDGSSSDIEGNVDADDIEGSGTSTSPDDEAGQGAGAGTSTDGASTDEEPNDNYDIPSEEEQAERDRMMEELREEIEKAIQKQNDFMDGDIDKKGLSKNDARKVNAASNNDAQFNQVGGQFEDGEGNMYRLDKRNCLVVKGLSTELIASGLLGTMATNPETYMKYIQKYGYTDYVTEGIVLGKMLGRKLQTRDEERTLKNTRLNNGRIDKRLMAELGFGNARIFAKEIHSSVTPALVHISVDASGSMSGSKWNAAMKTSIAIAQAASMISSMDVIISVRGSVSADRRNWRGSNGLTEETPLMWVIYDSRKQKLQAVKERLYAPQPNGTTPEGLCFEAIQKDIINDAKGKDMYFINVSDGAPYFQDYTGSVAYKHTNKQVQLMRNANINVLSYFVSNSEQEAIYAKSAFNAMYGKDAQYIDVNNLSQLAKSLNDLFTRKSW